ncbi:hypothetical protein FVB9532_03240 [Mesonia oceanica]|uniref:Uncharacterized protein n=1 Tax=Mesonia oceanica TaxID=2687242 RepID=A0AC61YCJ8_9FLAO|nr:hypothetical protein FVB9532_03240 [Mesonia oceanica]
MVVITQSPSFSLKITSKGIEIVDVQLLASVTSSSTVNVPNWEYV